MTRRNWVSLALWVVALGIWLIAGIAGSMPWWFVTVIAIALVLQVGRALISIRHRSNT